MKYMNTNGTDENKNSHLMIAFTDIKSINDTNKNLFMRFFLCVYLRFFLFRRPVHAFIVLTESILQLTNYHQGFCTALLRLENLWTAIDIIIYYSFVFVSFHLPTFFAPIADKNNNDIFLFTIHDISIIYILCIRHYIIIVILSNKNFIDNMKNAFSPIIQPPQR